jgi:hypothetical protein
MKYGYKEIRTIDADAVRKLCIAKEWYTLGTNEEYAHLLLDIIPSIENVTSDELVEIAENIKEHSDTEYELTSIMYELARICHSFFEEV